MSRERKVLVKKWLDFEKQFARFTGEKRNGNISLREFYGHFAFPGLDEIINDYEKLRFGCVEASYKVSLLCKWEKNMEKLLLFLKKEGAKYVKRK